MILKCLISVQKTLLRSSAPEPSLQSQDVIHSCGYMQCSGSLTFVPCLRLGPWGGHPCSLCLHIYATEPLLSCAGGVALVFLPLRTVTPSWNHRDISCSFPSYTDLLSSLQDAMWTTVLEV